MVTPRLLLGSLKSSPLRSRCYPSRSRAFATKLSPPSKAIVYEQHGPPDQVTRLIDLPPVELKANDVCVKMLAAPINPSDINKIEALGSFPAGILVTEVDEFRECRTMINCILRLVKSGSFEYEMELVPFEDFNIALEKALGKLGSHPKQVIKF